MQNLLSKIYKSLHARDTSGSMLSAVTAWLHYRRAIACVQYFK